LTQSPCYKTDFSSICNSLRGKLVWPYNRFMKEILDIHSTKSSRTGIAGLAESLFRKFKMTCFTLMLAPIGVLYVLCMGLALTPGVMLYDLATNATASAPFWLKSMVLGGTLACGYIMYGLSLIIVVPLVNKLLPLRVKPLRASWFSLSVIPWYYHNALTYLVRYTFLEFITPTPLNILFFKMMGMKIGKGSMINTSNISDPCLIEIGDFVTIGGSATLVAHYGMKGMLIIDKLIIKDKATIGLKASLFGDVVIGVGQTIKPHEVILPKTRIPDKTDETIAA
jgi:hypothetical protein